MIEIDGVSCSYEDKIILENISLSLPKHLTILGANGAGKSTLARAISGLIPYSGTIKLFSQDRETLAPKEMAKLLSYIPAKLESYENTMRVDAFILLGRFPYKKSFFEYGREDRDIASSYMELLGITNLRSQTINSLSSGETQLTLIAQALTQQSKIIIFDEPTANLDPKNSKIIAHHIKSLQHKHQIILITHDLALAAYLETPIAFIKESKLHYFEENFFHNTTLQELYGVEFDSLVVRYD